MSGRRGARRIDTRLRARRWLRIAEASAWTLGLLLLGFYLVARGHGALAGAADVARFDQARAELAQDGIGSAGRLSGRLEIEGSYDMSLWADGRVEAYRQSLARELELPAAVLRIPKIGLEVPVHEGTGELVLNRAVGRIVGTALWDMGGNVGIAGHRDGFFRGLKEMELGDEIRVETLSGEETYVVDRISIVDPQDVHVLDPTPEPAVTLVTCYPFYFVGKAPRRYIVRATMTKPETEATEIVPAVASAQTDAGRKP